jgi:SAM-dependent methyltransferase
MPPSAPDFRIRAQLVERMDEPCSRDELRACLRDIARTNRWTLAYRPTLHWLETFKIPAAMLARPVRILDVGCGYGDGLRRIEQWARGHNLAVELTGLDMNPDAAAIAAEATPAGSRIEWVSANVFAYTPRRQVDLIVSSLFAHHLDEDEVVQFLKWMDRHAALGWFINDLSRAPVPYHIFRVVAALTGLHHFVRNDGPVSIARAFVAADWERMCTSVGLAPPEIEIRAFKPARLCVARRKAR